MTFAQKERARIGKVEQDQIDSSKKKDKLDDPIALKMKALETSSSEDQGPFNVKGMCYNSLCLHLRKDCPCVKVQCNSCNQFLRRIDFRKHSCYKKLGQLDKDLLVASKSELLQIFLEVQKLN